MTSGSNVEVHWHGDLFFLRTCARIAMADQA